MQVTIPEASRRLAQLIRSVQAGDEVIIAAGENPGGAAAAGRASERGGPQEPGRGRTILHWLKRHKLPPESRRSAEDIDAAIAANARRGTDLFMGY